VRSHWFGGGLVGAGTCTITAGGPPTRAWVVVRTVVGPPLSVVECGVGGVRSGGCLFVVLFLSCCCVCDLFLLLQQASC